MPSTVATLLFADIYVGVSVVSYFSAVPLSIVVPSKKPAIVADSPTCKPRFSAAAFTFSSVVLSVFTNEPGVVSSFAQYSSHSSGVVGYSSTPVNTSSMNALYSSEISLPLLPSVKPTTSFGNISLSSRGFTFFTLRVITFLRSVSGTVTVIVSLPSELHTKFVP